MSSSLGEQRNRRRRRTSHEVPRRAATRALLLALALAIAALFSSAAASPADAIPRKRAEKIALETLKPQQQPGEVVVFGLHKPLQGRQAVFAAHAGKSGTGLGRMDGVTREVTRIETLGRRTWFFWLDLRYGAMFSKPSVLLLIDDSTGEVRRQKRLQWWPLIDGEPPPFLSRQRNYFGRRYQVFSSLRTSSRLAPSAAAPVSAPAFAADDEPGDSRLPPDAFKDDCLLAIEHRLIVKPPIRRGDIPPEDKREVAAFLKTVGEMRAWADSVGLRFFKASARDPATAHDVARKTEHLVEREGCKDVFIYVAAHGDKDGFFDTGTEISARRDGDRLEVRAERSTISWTQLSELVGRYEERGITFKFKLDTCYSGQAIEALREHDNVLLVETAAAADELGYFYLPAVETASGKVVGNPDNERQLLEFTNGDLAGLRQFASDAEEVLHGLDESERQNTSLLAWALARAHTLGASHDFARATEKTKPQLYTRFTPSPPPSEGGGE